MDKHRARLSMRQRRRDDAENSYLARFEHVSQQLNLKMTGERKRQEATLHSKLADRRDSSGALPPMQRGLDAEGKEGSASNAVGPVQSLSGLHALPPIAHVSGSTPTQVPVFTIGNRGSHIVAAEISPLNGFERTPNMYETDTSDEEGGGIVVDLQGQPRIDSARQRTYTRPGWKAPENPRLPIVVMTAARNIAARFLQRWWRRCMRRRRLEQLRLRAAEDRARGRANGQHVVTSPIPPPAASRVRRHDSLQGVGEQPPPGVTPHPPSKEAGTEVKRYGCVLCVRLC